MRNGIRLFREAKGLNRAELARMVGTTRQTIGRLESGKRKISPEWAEKLAQALECAPHEIIYPDAGDYDLSQLVSIFPFGDEAGAKDPEIRLSYGLIERMAANMERRNLTEIVIESDDMRNHFRRGDAILIDTGDKNPNRPGVFYLDIQGEYLWRHLAPLSEAGKYQMRADDDALPVEIVTIDQIKILGRARIRISPV